MLKHTKKIAGFLSLSLLFACQSIDEKKAEQQPDDKQKSAQTDKPKAHRASLSGLSGLYFARLPCPECGSVRVNLILEANGSYDKTEEFKDNDDVYFESGTWTLQNGTVVLSPTANGQQMQSTIRFFRLQGNDLILTTQEGEPYPGNSDDYRFKKKQ